MHTFLSSSWMNGSKMWADCGANGNNDNNPGWRDSDFISVALAATGLDRLTDGGTISAVWDQQIRTLCLLLLDL